MYGNMLILRKIARTLEGVESELKEINRKLDSE